MLVQMKGIKDGYLTPNQLHQNHPNIRFAFRNTENRVKFLTWPMEIYRLSRTFPFFLNQG